MSTKLDGEVLRILDRNTSVFIGVTTSGPAADQVVCFGNHAFNIADFLKAAEYVLLAGDLGGDDCPRRRFFRNVCEMQEGEGRGFGTKRLRPSHDRLMAGTQAPL